MLSNDVGSVGYNIVSPDLATGHNLPFSGLHPAPAISIVPLCPVLPAISFPVFLTASRVYPVNYLPAPKGP
jgi:hypothetical protein